MVFTTRTLCRGNFTEMLHCLCFSFRCRFCSEMQGFTAMSKTLSNQRPKAATYLCRSAAKARFDNRLKPQGGVSKGEGSQPLPFGRFKGKRFLRKGGNRNPPFLKWRSLDTFFRQGKKVSRRRHPAPGRGTPLASLCEGGQAVEKACHCEPVRRLAWQSVLKTHDFCALAWICS